MPPEFQHYKKRIDAHIAAFLKTQGKELSQVNHWGGDVISRLADFVSQGKTIRGGLVLFTTEMFQTPLSSDALICASAIELFQSGLLIHDDIMDNDAVRRRKKSIYAQYQEEGEQRHIPDTIHFGESMGICAGDAAFFLAFSMLSTMEGKNLPTQSIYKLLTDEYIIVCVAQMEDIALGMMPTIPTKEEILRVYRYKTARYTFTLPFLTGSLLASISPNEALKLEELGENMGILFQIQDDLLNLVGDTQDTGKPVGSDIREGKKTLAYLMLNTRAGKGEKEKLSHIFGSPQISQEDITYVHALLAKYDVVKDLQSTMNTYGEAAKSAISMLPVEKNYRQALHSMVAFTQERRV